MLRNYIKIAFRNLVNKRIYSAINILGLSVGMACCLLIVMLLYHEWTYDTFHKYGNLIYRIVIKETAPDGSVDYRQLIQPSVGPAADSAYAGIEKMTRLIGGNLHLQKEDQTFSEHVYMVDSGFFNMFSFPLLAGDRGSALRNMHEMIITESMAKKYFDIEEGEYNEVLGEHLTIKQGEDKFEFSVTGVMKSIPEESSMQFDVLISFENYFLEKDGRIYLGGNDWGGKNTMFVLLGEDIKAKDLETALQPFTNTVLAKRIKARRDAGYIAGDEDAFRLVLQPLSRVHFDTEIGTSYLESTHNPTYSYVLGGIGALVLLIACINFITLSIGSSTTRAREVGVRKVLGAQRTQLMKQYWERPCCLQYWP